MPIVGLRILPPFAIARFGSSPNPLEAFELKVPDDHAHTARGHATHARGHAEEAVKAHTDEHGKNSSKRCMTQNNEGGHSRPPLFWFGRKPLFWFGRKPDTPNLQHYAHAKIGGNPKQKLSL